MTHTHAASTVQTIYVVRHAKAMEREEWTGDDRLRPLTDAGRRQAEALREQYSSVPLRWIRSSPALRCVETVSPLAEALGMRVEEDERLFEGHRIELPRDHGHFMICAHGDNIPWLLDELGLEWDHCRKGSVWTIRFDSTGALMHPHYDETPGT